ncbi:hypothetical protein EV646_10652 [Kribbella antiqua]|uniref:Uncharacterized protein n=1 Tax=Kribbella antiqua TaxID=2512217 RepID=A0A4R2INS0_9ACTN|nr:hypothetical protein [Kribbella antiqua]TCO46813.1 hypothetical protein EV646_10652 [Kribbella antiqua]
MAIATYQPIVDLLSASGIAKQVDGVWYFDIRKYVDLVRAGWRWDTLPGNTAYPVRKRILVTTTDPRTSNSAAMFLAITSYVTNNSTVVQSAADEKKVLPLVAPLVLMYPAPTVQSRHTLLALKPGGDKLGDLLTTDPELQQLAAKHGFRTADADEFTKVVTQYSVPAVAKQILDVADTPTYETLEHLLDGVSKSYR